MQLFKMEYHLPPMTAFNEGDVCLDERGNVFEVIDNKLELRISSSLIFVNQEEYSNRYKYNYGREPLKPYSVLTTLSEHRMMKMFKALVNHYWNVDERIRIRP